MGAYDGYKYAKKKNLKGWKKGAAVVGGALLGSINPFKVVKAAKTGYKAYKASKYTKKVVSSAKKTKSVKKASTKAKSTVVTKKTVKKTTTAKSTKKTTQTVKKQTNQVKSSAKSVKTLTPSKPLEREKSSAITSYYPSNNGALDGSEKRVYLMPGDKIDRYGRMAGKYFSPLGTPIENRALPHNAKEGLYSQFEIIKPFEVEASIIAPAFGKVGGGIQYRVPVTAEILKKRGFIKEIGR